MGQKQNIPHVISNFWNFSYDINASQTIYHEEDAQSWLKLHFENCKLNSVNFIEKMRFFRNLQFSKLKILISSFEMIIILLQIDQKLTFNVFHILNHGYISKIEKNIWWSRPPPQKKAFFLGGGSVASHIFFNFGDTTMIQNIKHFKSKFLIDL